MSFRQDRLTFFGVLIAVVIAVLGYLQLGSIYPVEGRAQSSGERGDEVEKKKDEPSSDSDVRREDASP